jgi:molecular chaperone DnaK (HSP70)
MFKILKSKAEGELIEGEELAKRELQQLEFIIVEKTKIELSTYDTVYPEIIHDDVDLEIEVTREEFEKKKKRLLMKTINRTKQLIADYPNNKPEYIIVAGGASQMPMVERGLREN